MFCWVTDGTVYCCICCMYMGCPNSINLIISYYINRIICCYSLQLQQWRSAICDTQATECTLLFLRYSSYSITLNSPTRFNPKGLIIIWEPNKTIPHKTKLATFVHSWLFYTMWIMYWSGSLVLCRTVLVWFPDDNPLWIKTCRIIQFDILRNNVLLLVGWVLWIVYQQCMYCIIYS